MASFPPSRPSTSGRSGKEKEIGYWKVEVEEIGEDSTPIRLQNKGSGEQIFKDNCSKPPLHGKGKMNPSGEAMSNISREKDNAPVSVNAVNYRTNMEVIYSAKQVPPRLNGPQVRMSDPSHVPDVGRNKKQKISCEFHAKGWCIRGTSCSFLHSDEGFDAFNKKASSGDSISPRQCGDSHKFSHQSKLVVLQRVDALGENPLLVGESAPHDLCTSNFSIGGRQNRWEMSLGHFPSASSSSNHWEPSVPFMPSHYITQELLMKENLCDPWHESFLERVPKDGPSVKIDSQIQLGQRSDPKVEGSSKDGSEADFRGKKSLKEFESALIVHIKGLLEPAWLAGHVTKDGFKLIVQKSVEKVIKSFQPNHIPSSSESVRLYISSSQAKLDKLVQDYLERYRKS